MKLETLAEEFQGNANLEANYNLYYFANAEGGILPYQLQDKEYNLN